MFSVQLYIFAFILLFLLWLSMGAFISALNVFILDRFGLGEANVYVHLGIGVTGLVILGVILWCANLDTSAVLGVDCS